MAGEVVEEDSETGLLLVATDVDVSVYDLPVHKLYAKYNTSLETGLKYNHAERLQLRSEMGANIIPPPLDCPAWLCCLLPCFLKTKKMKYFKSLQPKVVQVLLNNKYISMDPTGVLVGDIVKIEAGMYVPADVRLLKIIEAPCIFDARAITGTGSSSSFSEREAIVNTIEEGNDNFSCADSDGGSVGHHCPSNYLGSVFDPINNLNVACAGFRCTQGECIGIVVATGAETLLAKMIKRKEWPPLS